MNLRRINQALLLLVVTLCVIMALMLTDSRSRAEAPYRNPARPKHLTPGPIGPYMPRHHNASKKRATPLPPHHAKRAHNKGKSSKPGAHAYADNHNGRQALMLKGRAVVRRATNTNS